jgi:methylthioribose-1-phosphate isomerase
MPLGAADPAALCASRGIAATKGGEKMTVIREAPAVAVAAVYSIAMRLYSS